MWQVIGFAAAAWLCVGLWTLYQTVEMIRRDGMGVYDEVYMMTVHFFRELKQGEELKPEDDTPELRSFFTHTMVAVLCVMVLFGWPFFISDVWGRDDDDDGDGTHQGA